MSEYYRNKFIWEFESQLRRPTWNDKEIKELNASEFYWKPEEDSFERAGSYLNSYVPDVAEKYVVVSQDQLKSKIVYSATKWVETKEGFKPFSSEFEFFEDMLEFLG